MILRFLLLFVVSFFSFQFLFGVDIQQTIQEDISITKTLNGNHIILVRGTFEFYNPSISSQVYEYSFSVDSPNGIYGSFTSLNGDNTIDYLGFSGFDLMPNESRRLGYRFSGSINQSDIDYFANGGSFIERFGIPRYVVKSSISVDKPTREDVNITNTSTRAVSSRIRNPTEFGVRIVDLEIFRTQISDVFLESAFSVGSRQNIFVEPFGYQEVGFYDRNSSDSSVYWVKTIVSANWDWNISTSYSFVIQQPSPSGGGGGGSSGGRPSTGGISDLVDEGSSLENLVIKKDVDKVFVSKGEEVTVYLKILNLGESTIKDISFRDEIPEGYVLKSIDGARVDGNILHFSIDELEGYSEKVLEYVIVKEDDTPGSLTYLKPVDFDGDATVEGVLLLDEVLGNAKLFVQKEIEWVDSKYSRIKITIKNVGNGIVNNFRLIDDIEQRYIIKEISKNFADLKRGEWIINELTPGSEWEVEYLVESHEGISQLPLLTGVEESNVYGTVIFDSQIHTIITQGSSLPEKIGFGITIFLVLLYFLF